MATYWKSVPNLVESDLGSIRVRGRAGLTVSYGGRDHEVSSEMLTPPRSIVLHPRDADLRGLADADAIVAFIVEGLTWDGFTVELG